MRRITIRYPAFPDTHFAPDCVVHPKGARGLAQRVIEEATVVQVDVVQDGAALDIVMDVPDDELPESFPEMHVSYDGSTRPITERV